MALARSVGQQSRQNGLGEEVGVAVVSDETGPNVVNNLATSSGSTKMQMPLSQGPSKVIVVAGDARYLPPFDHPALTEVSSPGTLPRGNPAAHAVMRAISLVASSRLSLVSSSPTRPVPTSNRTLDVYTPLTPLESQYYRLTSSGSGGLRPNGYLCLNLTLYVTHEPCVMCSMALLHSRFGRVVIGQRMPATGAICAETAAAASQRGEGGTQGNGYGLWWRRDMNWKMLGWEWIDEECSEVDAENTVAPDIHV